ncbi:hypothetical protein B0H10DRAFT_2241817 [Mycena sp. CBHHK59/15]|nr:hypothetical protein B0H10DRAFT_2241817 [Mycena sp. CBHHK59/15]
MALTLDNVGKCNNNDCTASCSDFFCENLASGASLRGVKCSVCGCYVGQHRLPDFAPSITPSEAPAGPQPKEGPVEPQPTAPKVTATQSTLNGSRPTPRTFRDVANKRQADIKAHMPAGIFHPAQQSQVDGDLNPYDSKAKRRNRHPPKAATKEKAPSVAAPREKKRVMQEYTVIVVEGTKLVARGEYVKPDANKLNDLADEGYMRKISIPADATPDEVRDAVLDAFEDIPEVAEYGFRLLRVKSAMKRVSGEWKKKKGVKSLLCPIKGTKVLNKMNWDRSLADTTIRHAGRAFNLVEDLDPDSEDSSTESDSEGDAASFGKATIPQSAQNSETICSGSRFCLTAKEMEPQLKSRRPQAKNKDASTSSSEEDPRPTKKQKTSESFGKDKSKIPTGTRDEDVSMSSDEAIENREKKDKPKAKAPKEDESKGHKDVGAQEHGDDTKMAGDSDVDSDVDGTDKPDDTDRYAFKRSEQGWSRRKVQGTRRGKGANASGKKDYKGKGKARQQSPFRFHDDIDESAPVHAEHVQMKRLLKNMTKPKAASDWWLEKIPQEYNELEKLEHLIPEWMAMTLGSMISVQMFYEYFRPRFLVHLEPLLAVGTALPRPSTQLASDDDEEEFDSLFFIEVHSASRSLLFSLQHFRFKHPRWLWDPKGCRDLNEVLFRTGNSKFTRSVGVRADRIIKMGLPNNRMLEALKRIDVHRDSAASLAFGLATVFGHVKESKQMSKDVLIDGPHGLPYFYEHIVCCVLDELEHLEYDTILNDVSLCCAGLARKSTSFVKSGGDTSGPHSHTHSAPPNTGGSSKPNTRSAGASTDEKKKASISSESEFESSSDESDDDDPGSAAEATKARQGHASSDEALKAESSARRTKRRKSRSKKPIFVESTSESESAPPPKRKAAQSEESKKRPPPKPQPSSSAPPPPRSPPTAGPSSGYNFRPKPKPSYRGTPGYKPGNGWGDARFWEQFLPLPLAQKNPRPESGVDREASAVTLPPSCGESAPKPNSFVRVKSAYPVP